MNHTFPFFFILIILLITPVYAGESDDSDDGDNIIDKAAEKALAKLKAEFASLMDIELKNIISKSYETTKSFFIASDGTGIFNKIFSLIESIGRSIDKTIDWFFYKSIFGKGFHTWASEKSAKWGPLSPIVFISLEAIYIWILFFCATIVFSIPYRFVKVRYIKTTKILIRGKGTPSTPYKEVVVKHPKLTTSKEYQKFRKSYDETNKKVKNAKDYL